ncbi:hypothetical protein LJR219_000654 [Phenylobacterium sp. LjRoot219]|uniref:hypothetical protein n=1 Tax=Phenylobacterium sp. LjRoot219 TaxID=3342283 RepID=UPI003ED014FE
MKAGSIKRFVVGASVGATLLGGVAHAAPPKDLADLVGVYASSGEKTLQRRGYTQVKSTAIGGSRYGYWSNKEVCAEVQLADARFITINQVEYAGACGPAPPPPGKGAPAPAAVDLRFPPGASSVTVTGTVRGHDARAYRLTLRRGQTLNARLTSRSRFLYLTITRPDGGVLFDGASSAAGNAFRGVTPASGPYRLQVYLVRAAARRGGVADYSLAVSAK